MSEQMRRDMAHILGWMTIGLSLAALLSVIYALDAASNGRWFKAAIDVVALLIYGNGALVSFRRRLNYVDASPADRPSGES